MCAWSYMLSNVYTPSAHTFYQTSQHSLRRLDHLYYINCWMMRKMKTNFSLITLQTNSLSISTWCDESIPLCCSICRHPFQLSPICLWWTPGWGQLAQPRDKLTVLSGRFIATSVRMGANFVCIGGRYTQVHVSYEVWFSTYIAWGIPIYKVIGFQ